MIPQVGKLGSDLPGLTRYLFGPGKANEHTGQRLIAGSGTLAVEWGGTPLTADEVATLGRIVEADWRHARAEMLAAVGPRYPAAAPRGDAVEPENSATPAGERTVDEPWSAPAATSGRTGAWRPHVFHVSLALHPTEGELTDGAWEQIAQAYVERMGFTERSGKAGCQWYAVRHGRSAGSAEFPQGNDHIHIAVCLVRGDGTWASEWQSKSRSQRICRELEREFGLRPLHETGAERGRPHPSAAELRRATEAGREPERDRLRRVVLSAAVGAQNEYEFLRNLLDDGVRVRPRWAAGGRESVEGYSVRFRDAARPVWFGGGKLAPELSLPKLRAHWRETDETREAVLTAWRGGRVPETPVPSGSREHWSLASRELGLLTKRLAAVPPYDVEQARAAARDAAGAAAELSLRVGGDDGARLARLADSFERCSRPTPSVVGLSPFPAGVMAARQLRLALRAAGRNDAAAWLAVLQQLGRTAEALARLQRHRGQLRSAQQLEGAVRGDLATIHQRLTAVDVGAAAGRGAPTPSGRTVDPQVAARARTAGPRSQPERGYERN